MDFYCPICKNDLEQYFDNNPFSIYQEDYLKCPGCKSVLRGDYDETWDGKEETQYFGLNVVEKKNDW